MSWQEGEGYDPADEVDGSTNPLADYAEGAYLSAAAAWLVKVELARSVWADPRATGQDRTDARMEVTVSARLAELNIRMAAACGAYQDRQPRVEMKTGWLTDAVGDTMAKTPDEVATEIREQVQADAEAHQAETLRPGTDPEPEGSAGDLWTPDGKWFWYAVNGHASPDPGDQHAERWLLVRHYGQALRWQGEQGTKPIPHTWDEVGDMRSPGEREVVLRRPTAAERTAFYGPELDPAPTPPEHACQQFVALEGVLPATTTLCERCGASAEAHLLKMFGPRQGGILADQIKSAETRAMLPPREERRSRGGAAQWREG